MHTMKFKRAMLVLTLLVMTLSAVTSGTIAWFTDSVTSENNVITSGNLDIEMSYLDGNTWKDASKGAIFNYSLWEPGYTQVREVKIENKGNLALKFRLDIKPEGFETNNGANLADVIEVYVGEGTAPKNLDEVKQGRLAGTITQLLKDEDGAAYGVLLPAGETSDVYPVASVETWLALHMQESAGNEYQNLSVGNGFALKLEATQFTYEEDSFNNQYDVNAGTGVDNWTGEADKDWGDEAPTDNVYMINTAEELAAFAAKVNGGDSFKGKTVKLGTDIDLNNNEWTPIGNWDSAFEGTFDGQGYTINNLFISEYEGEGVGLFGVAQNAIIKGVNVHNVNIDAYSMVATIVGCPYKGCTISDCHVTGDINLVAEFAYVGGIAAYGYVDIDNCSVIADGTGVIMSKTRNAIGGISAWLMEDVSSVINCTVKNVEMTGYANLGAISGFAHRNAVIDGCTAENIVLNKFRVDGQPSIGLACGGYNYNASKPVTITNNTFKNITLNGTVVTTSTADIMHGSEYDGKLQANFVLDNNTTENIVNNLVYVSAFESVTTAEALKAALSDGKSVTLNADISITGETAGHYITVNGAAVAINLNGHDINAEIGDVTSNSSIFRVINGGTLAIGGEGDVHIKTAKAENKLVALISNEGGNVVINGGVYTIEALEYPDALIPCFIDNNSTLGKSTLTINGGSFTFHRNLFRNFANNSAEKPAIIIINGGEFNGKTDDAGGIWNQKTNSTRPEGAGVIIVNGGTFNNVTISNGFSTGVTVNNGVNVQVTTD